MTASDPIEIAPRAPNPTRLRTLIVDDYKAVRATLRMHLEHQHIFEVIGLAADGAEAVALAGALAPDLILMDVNMPVMNGLEATRHIKAQDHPPRIIIVSTEEPAVIRAALLAGADGFCDKQHINRDLLAQVRNLFPNV
jgi:DNA-binding NarL/FixJ family response regulator